MNCGGRTNVIQIQGNYFSRGRACIYCVISNTRGNRWIHYFTRIRFKRLREWITNIENRDDLQIYHKQVKNICVRSYMCVIILRDYS